MAADWMPIRLDLKDDPAVITIAHETGLDEHGVVGRLVAVWAWANAHTTDGNASGNALGVTVAWLDRYVGVTGFARAMIAVQWLDTVDASDPSEPDSDDSIICFPKFDRWNSQAAKRRIDAANRVRAHRAARNDKETQTQRACNNSGVTDRVTKEEKRTEEKNAPSTKVQVPVAAQPGDAGPQQAPPSADTPPPKAKPAKKSKADPKPVPDSPHHRSIARFCEAWAAKYGEKYPFMGGKDAAAVQQMLKLAGSEERFADCVARFLACDDPFIVKNNHGIGNMIAQFQRWAVDAPPAARRGAPSFLDGARDALEGFLSRGNESEAA